MKKLVSILLALVMIFSLSITAFAEDNATLTITNSENRTFAGYQLLELTTSLKDPNAGADHTHDDECYNYGYSFKRSETDDDVIVSPYYEILQKEVFNNSSDYFWDSINTVKPGAYTAITEVQILEYLESQSGDDEAGYHTMRQVADRLYRAIKADTSISPDRENMTGSNDNIEQGYWLIADVTDLDGNEANSLVMVATQGKDNVTIQTKTALPTLEKKVKDIEDSEDSNILDNAWNNTADHDIGDTIPFKLTATLPDNAQYYTSYKMIFHDTLSEGLTLKADSIKVYMYTSKHRADGDTDLNNYNEDVTSSFNPSAVDKNGNFSISCDDIFQITGVTKETAFVVYYEAELNENAVVGAAGNPNTAYLEFSNNPYGGGTGNTEPSKVVVFTYKLIVNKVDPNSQPLAGAGFTLKKKMPDQTYELIEKINAGTATSFTWTGLDDGDYLLEESEVPEGYNGMADIKFTISADHDDQTLKLVSLDGGVMGPGIVEIDDEGTGTITKDIVNNTGTILPETGAKGTIMLIGTSTLLVMVAGVFMITRKKMSIYED